ncbi:MAG: DUF1697 domain-containing protein [Steroidobacteraceae bacterium]
MPTYAAFLRGVTPTNAKMSDLRECFEAVGFQNVRTILGSGNVVFSARAAARPALERKIETSMQRRLGRIFAATIRSADELAELIASDPYQPFRLVARTKRIVTLLHATPDLHVPLPIELEGARILCIRGTEVFSAYVPSAKGPVFMTLIEKTFGKDLTTRTWDTIRKVTAAAA